MVWGTEEGFVVACYSIVMVRLVSCVPFVREVVVFVEVVAACRSVRMCTAVRCLVTAQGICGRLVYSIQKVHRDHHVWRSQADCG